MPSETERMPTVPTENAPAGDVGDRSAPEAPCGAAPSGLPVSTFCMSRALPIETKAANSPEQLELKYPEA